MNKNLVILIFMFSVLFWSCTAQKEGSKVARYFAEIPAKYKFGYSIKEEGGNWLRVDEQDTPPEMRKILIDEQNNYLQIGFGTEASTDSVSLKIFVSQGADFIAVSHFNKTENLNGGLVSSEMYLLKKEGNKWKEVENEAVSNIQIQDFYSEKIKVIEGYAALKYNLGANNSLTVELMTGYSAELDCMGGRSGEVSGEAQKAACLLVEKKKQDAKILNWDSETGKFK